ncbi:hypothetical protein EGX98_02510 [Fusobacterium necrophorum]|uniref:Uncharacterized protein n=1 Tax=Fusobacterium necrophorum BL TaxID=1441732 RepID=A0AB73BVY4_9FUSO|nr:hypothetical protein [Fusobacterium necrophorum]AYZ73025.1 hypothetical protein EGX98_02510 [Fusobacterium necrophorum]AZW08975.1 hypothetical protein EO219_04885 [Fusobacterium necrophorum subsp. necrophorum]KDE62948.1 hypothetical protein FUSO3_06520 [Fusobacterium necrophorum BL]KDE66353.1 hypothetical protein FUSO6_12185 [Fusobacterium necrophorum DAB]KDE72865.1 hypothetical protein FUSO7_07610 [Fusobacterium necrophorum BFTR-2]
MSTKEIIEKRVKSLTISIKREKAILQELESDRATIQRIREWEETGVALASDSHYASYEEWKSSLQKQIKRGESSLENLKTKKAELEAFQFYLDKIGA